MHVSHGATATALQGEHGTILNPAHGKQRCDGDLYFKPHNSLYLVRQFYNYDPVLVWRPGSPLDDLSVSSTLMPSTGSLPCMSAQKIHQARLEKHIQQVQGKE